MDKETNRNNKPEDVLIDVVVFENTEIVIKSMILTELVTDIHYEVNSDHAIYLADMFYNICAGVFEVMIADQTIDGIDIDVANDNLIKIIKNNIKTFVFNIEKMYVALEEYACEFLLDMVEKNEKQERIAKVYSNEKEITETPVTEETVDEKEKKQTAKKTKPIEKYFLST